MIRERWRFVGQGKKRKLRRVDDDAPLSRGAGLQIIGDIKPYMSPLGTGEVSSRHQRREELKRNNCREVDPSEKTPQRRPDPLDRTLSRIFGPD